MQGLQHDALVVGAGGPLGPAVLERALACGGFARVHAVAEEKVAPALRGFMAHPWADLQEPAATAAPLPALAFVVFDRERMANGRDDAFHRPDPGTLPALAGALHARGVQRLVVVQPHAAASLPQALREGLATLDEAAVAALGFDHLVVMRASRDLGADGAPRRSVPERLAGWMLGQLRWMVPQREQPVRAASVAALAVAIARALGHAQDRDAAASSTRVVPADLVWRAAQTRDVDALAQAWLAGRALPEPRVAAPRL
jgi:hypothetical protein